MLAWLGRLLRGAGCEEPDPATRAAPAPRVLWIELTSRCPLDCVFCSRKMLRGSGEDLDFGLYLDVLRSAGRPQTVCLNYSGESTHYPFLAKAIARAKEAGAGTELASALAAAPPPAVRALVDSGLDVLMVSVHTLEPHRWRTVCRGSSPDALRRNMAILLDAKRERGRATPRVMLTFVAMMDNLGELPGVGEYAREVGAGGVFVIPVLRRDEIPERFERELENGRPTPAFVDAVRSAVSESQRRVPEIPFTVLTCGSIVPEAPARLGATPRIYPGVLPPGARIATCEQNPWETTHVLANGDVVSCEVRDRAPLGNLHREPLDRIWSGRSYTDFRRRYVAGEIPECRTCPWKLAHRPGPLRSAVSARDGNCRELWRGWHGPEPGLRWSGRQSLAVLAAPRSARKLVVQGMLPEGREGRGTLRVSTGDLLLGEVHGESTFERSFELSRGHPPVLAVEFEATAPVCPAREGIGPDERELGFALFSLRVTR